MAPGLRPPAARPSLTCVCPRVRRWQSGRAAGDPALGRFLADTLALVPHLAKPDFERLFNEGVQARGAGRVGGGGRTWGGGKGKGGATEDCPRKGADARGLGAAVQSADCHPSSRYLAQATAPEPLHPRISVSRAPWPLLALHTSHFLSPVRPLPLRTPWWSPTCLTCCGRTSPWRSGWARRRCPSCRAARLVRRLSGVGSRGCCVAERGVERAWVRSRGARAADGVAGGRCWLRARGPSLCGAQEGRQGGAVVARAECG